MAGLGNRYRPGIYMINNPVSSTIEYVVDNERFTIGQDEAVVIKVFDYMRYDTIGGYLIVNRIGNNDNIVNGGYNPT